MKQLIQVSNSEMDVVALIRFVANLGEQNKPAYTDDAKQLCYGKNIVDQIYFTSPVYNDTGIASYQRFYLNIKDIKNILDTINEIQETATIGTIPDYLPF